MSGLFLSLVSSADGSSSWRGSTLQVNGGTLGTMTWSFNSVFPDRDATGYEIGASIMQLMNTAFSGNITFTFSTTDPSSSNAKGVSITASTSVTWTVSDGLRALMGWPSLTTSATLETASSESVAGSWRGTVGFAQRLRHDTSTGVVSRFGAYMPGHQATAHFFPVVFSVIDEAEAAALADVLALSSSPRRANIYEEHTAGWGEGAVGKVDVTRANLTHYNMKMQVVG